MRNLSLLAIILLPAASFAGGYVVPNINARDLAMVGAPVADQDSAAATYQNPAALAKLSGLNISVGTSLIDVRTTWNDPTGANPSVSNTPKAAFPPAIYAAYGFDLPNQMRAGVGLGLTVPGGGFVFWPGDWPGRNEILTVDRKIFGTYLTGGLQVLPQLRVGGGLIYYYMTEHLTQGLNFLQPASAPQSQIDLGTAGGQASWDISAEVTPMADVPLTIAVDYKHQGVMKATGHAHGENVPAALLPRLQDQGVTHYLTYPNQFNLGAAYKVVPGATVAFDWTLERQIVYVNDPVTGDRGVTVVVPRNYTNDWTLRLGGEYTLPMLPLRVRAGLEYDHAPQPSSTISPTLPTANTWDLGLGAGYAVMPGLEVNAAFYHAFYAASQTTGLEAFPGNYDDSANIYALGITWRMGAGK